MNKLDACHGIAVALMLEFALLVALGATALILDACGVLRWTL